MFEKIRPKTEITNLIDKEEKIFKSEFDALRMKMAKTFEKTEKYPGILTFFILESTPNKKTTPALLSFFLMGAYIKTVEKFHLNPSFVLDLKDLEANNK